MTEGIENRLDAMEKNIEWLRDHDLDEDSVEAAKRLGLMKGDIQALIKVIARD